MTTKNFSLNTELRPILEEVAAQKGVPLWVELIPAGERVTGRDGRFWINDNPQGIIDAFLVNNADIPIDIEHATELKAPNGDPAPAVAWIKTLEVRQGGAIWGLVDWNDDGRWLMTDKSYKYLSPVFTSDRDTKTILQLYSAGLTNQPNLHLTALNRRTNSTEDTAMSLLAICTALGLAAESTEAQVLTAINSLKTDKDKAINSASNPSLEKFVPRADHDLALNRATEAETKLKEQEVVELNQKIEVELNSALKAGVITPATVDYHRACCKQENGLEQFKEFAAAAPKVIDNNDLGDKEVNQTKGLSDDDKAACRLLGIDEKDFSKNKEAA